VTKVPVAVGLERNAASALPGNIESLPLAGSPFWLFQDGGKQRTQHPSTNSFSFFYGCLSPGWPLWLSPVSWSRSTAHRGVPQGYPSQPVRDAEEFVRKSRRLFGCRPSQVSPQLRSQTTSSPYIWETRAEPLWGHLPYVPQCAAAVAAVGRCSYILTAHPAVLHILHLRFTRTITRGRGKAIQNQFNGDESAIAYPKDRLRAW